ncbi:hypothetical protein [Paenibacillus polymyxa]|uniref:hypothetical protein n=1 Tax=Paenibacillus polymyxa TaxID=1406 RepID=UPI002ED46860|nr:hypothetical protein [Paenibacillus polymyxa]
MTERNWQEDMKLSEQAKGWTYEITFNGEGNIVAKDANYTFAQVIAGDVGMSNAEIILDGLEALPYWLQEAEKWRIEAFRKYPTPDAYEAACAALEKHRARADQAESLIQQKDAEISRLFHIISMARTEHELWENPASAAECMMIWLDKAYETHVQAEHASGDTP